MPWTLILGTKPRLVRKGSNGGREGANKVIDAALESYGSHMDTVVLDSNFVDATEEITESELITFSKPT